VKHSRRSVEHRSRRRAPLVLLAVAVIPALVVYVMMLRSVPAAANGGASLEGLIDQRGQTIGRQAFSDRYKLLAFGYTQCPELCPATLLKMHVVLSGLGAPTSNVVPLFVTVDPEHDVPSVLGEYTARFDSRIIAISGDKIRLERYARAYGALPPPDAGGQHADSTPHAVRIFLLAPDNSVITTYELTDPTPLVVTDVERRVAAAATNVALPAHAPRADASG
jgi:protein SCO1/2